MLLGASILGGNGRLFAAKLWEVVALDGPQVLFVITAQKPPMHPEYQAAFRGSGDHRLRWLDRFHCEL